MKSGRHIPAAIALLACSGCGGSADGQGDAPVAAPAAALAAARPGAEFRWHARWMYQNLLMESCGRPKPALRRAVVLAKEAEAVKAFEQRMRPGPAASHLSVALDDIAYHQASDSPHCWSDRPGFGQVYVQMARDKVTAGLRAGEGAGGPPLAGRGEIYHASTRSGVSRLSAHADDDQILAPALAALTDFRRRLQNTPYALHFAIAEADVEYEASIVIIECADLDPETPAELTAEALRTVREAIAKASAIAGI